MNEAVEQLVDMTIPETLPELREQMKAALMVREQDVCDQLRMRALDEGLFPSIVALSLVEVGLGNRPSPEEFQLLQQQAQTERAQIAHGMEQMRLLAQWFQENGGEIGGGDQSG